MSAILEDDEPASAASRMTVLARQMPDFVNRLSDLTGSPTDELRSLHDAATGAMSYTDPAALDPRTPRILGVPDGFARPATTRLKLFRSALWQTIYLLDDPEAQHRTGFTTEELHRALRELFDTGTRGARAR